MRKILFLTILCLCVFPFPETYGSFGREGSVLAALYAAKAGIVEVRAEAHQIDRGVIVRSTRQGAGVVMDSQGVILTNRHIVDNAQKVTVRLHDGTTHEVHEGFTSQVFDLALVRIEPPEALEPVELSGKALSLGEDVFSVGSSFWIKGSIIRGKVFALGVEPEGGGEQLLIRTTINMYTGDSGAPLFDRRGKLAGLIFSRSSDGGTMALPVNVIRTLYEGYTQNTP